MSNTLHAIPLTMRYKGERDYLQGGDIYHALTAAIPDCCGQGDCAGSLSFHRFAHNQCDLFLAVQNEQMVVPSERMCDGVLRVDGEDWMFWMMETDRPVIDRYPFNEEEICRNAHIRDRTISIDNGLAFSPVEIAIALTKFLHNTAFPLVNQRWIFSKFEFLRLLEEEDRAHLQITLLMNLHNRITKSELRSGGELLGYIYFSAVAK